MKGTRWPLALLIVLASFFGFAPAAQADHLEIETSVPESVRAGDVIELRVVVRAAETNQRVPGATVVAEREASIVGFTGSVEIARAVTNDLGVATLRWRERSGTSSAVVVAYSVNGDAERESHPVAVVTIGDGPQIVRSSSGVRIPGFGAWVLIGILVGVWAIIQFAMVGPIRVAQLAHVEPRSGEESAE